jgi:hypothetical protein
VTGVHVPATTAAFKTIARCVASHAALAGAVIHTRNEIRACAISIVRRWLRNWNRMINNLNVCTAVPDLVSLLAIPSPAQDILARLVGHIDLVHDRKLVLAGVCWAQVSLSELIKSRLEHGSCWAVGSCGAMNRPLFRQASGDWIGSPLSSIRCNIGACHNLLVSLRVIIPMDGRITSKRESVALEACLREV